MEITGKEKKKNLRILLMKKIEVTYLYSYEVEKIKKISLIFVKTE